ncbi:MAG: di-trans,poly-cis-decaprenylcistransferase [Acidobacteria bacterium]|nr:di-trans,poly-cis-decaprenylcistransferase [Acidobacteriota bacterium]
MQKSIFTSESLGAVHVAIIMDGNGRWATKRGLPRVEGHRAGVATVRRIVEHAPRVGIKRLTLYAFSSDNWRRPRKEVEALFWLLRAYLRLESQRLRQRGVCLKVIGRRDRLPRVVVREIEKVETLTAQGDSLHLRVAIDYSSRDAITRALAKLTSGCSLSEPLSIELLRHRISDELTGQSGEVDLLIRTGGEKRLSDFLLWESAYAELLFTDRMWPDFDASDLEAAVEEFRRRSRRFGALPVPTTASLVATRERAQ